MESAKVSACHADGLGFATLAFNNMSGIGLPGTGRAEEVDGKELARQTDDQDYQVPFNFTGKIEKLTISLDRRRFTAEDEKRLKKRKRVRQTPSRGDWTPTLGTTAIGTKRTLKQRRPASGSGVPSDISARVLNSDDKKPSADEHVSFNFRLPSRQRYTS